MMLDEKQIEVIAKSFIKLGTYSITSVPFGLFMAPETLEWWAYVFVFSFGFVLLATGVYFSKTPKVSQKDITTTEIKKAIFHVNNAEIINK